jgi:hypothetical protein
VGTSAHGQHELSFGSTVSLVEIRGCDFCRDDPNLRLGHVEQVSSNESTGLLLCCPYCQCLYVDPADGITGPYPVDSADAARWMAWSPDDVLTAVRTTLSRSGDDSGWTFESADVEGDTVLVVVHTEDQRRYGVGFDLNDVPSGNNTGRLCATPEDWAFEIVLTMDEQVLTGGVRWAERTTRSDGLTVLRWVW